MRPDLISQLTPFLRSLVHASEAALLVDYDGTLAPFQTRREQAHPYPGVTSLLQTIVDTGRTRLVVVSGRDVSEVTALLNVHPRPEVWGVHGLQRLKTDGNLEMPKLSDRTLEGLEDAGRWLGYQQIRHTAEFKAGSIAVHWRGMSEIGVEDIRSRALLGWSSIAEHSGLNLLMFDGGVEIRAPQADKGRAVRTFLGELELKVPVAYLGDDSTDESAFLAMGDRGLSVLVRPEWRETAARFWLQPPGELLDFLGWWVKPPAASSTSIKGTARAVSG